MIARLHAVSEELADLDAGSRQWSVDDEHDPEGSTIAFERARIAAIAGEASRRLEEIDEALERLSTGRYGRCRTCGAPIGRERLLALPAADRCVTCTSSAANRFTP